MRTLVLLGWAWLAVGMRPSRMADLREQTGAMFYHGFDSYMRHAFPEDELRPVSCTPLMRDPQSTNVGLNDVLGNYSLTLIDSLSTLAILAGGAEGAHTGSRALADFQHGVQELVRHYGDGREGGLRARGFDLDSKVQVFETVIRGVGGLLSAHLFAVGELPIAGYEVQKGQTIEWLGGFEYDGQLLRLALDLGERLLPAFYTKTGLPYPRVNLRHGIPFYLNSPLHDSPPDTSSEPAEVTETCSAGAGSLVLEFTVLSRLTGDGRFEQAAKRAFWAVWDRRSPIGLVGNGIDAEHGTWTGVATGIGAGIDSFFEYALKSHILLSGSDHYYNNNNNTLWKSGRPRLDPNSLYPPLSIERNSADAFLGAWHKAHAAIKRHLYTDSIHPHYINGHITTGSPMAQWIDSLGAFYPGLLTLAGEMEEASRTQLVYAALWTRYSALPERWSLRDGSIESGLGWWPGRPEFVESTYYLYRATADPWHLYVGEMVLRDIKRRCWAECGWSGLEDVRTGEKSDRMESFFLGETAKYLYLLFDPGHALNKLDAAFVFSTEGHPLIIPRRGCPNTSRGRRHAKSKYKKNSDFTNSCPAPLPLPLTGSATAAREDLFHAAHLTGLHNVPNIHGPVEALSAQPSSHTTPARFRAKTNHTLFPWTLPRQMLPHNGVCAKMATQSLIRLEFPSNWGWKRAPDTSSSSGLSNTLFKAPKVVRAGQYGVEIVDMAGIKLTLKLVDDGAAWRVTMVGNVPLGRDEVVYIDGDMLGYSDELFRRVSDPTAVELVVALGDTNSTNDTSSYRSMLRSFVRAVTLAFDAEPTTAPTLVVPEIRLPAGIATGPGAPPLSALVLGAPPAKAPSEHAPKASDEIQWHSVFDAGDACEGLTPHAGQHHVVIVRRGGCTFVEKMGNIPDGGVVELVVVVDEYSDDDYEDGDGDGITIITEQITQPLLDPLTYPDGTPRVSRIPMVLVHAPMGTYRRFVGARGLGLRGKYWVESSGVRVENVRVL